MALQEIKILTVGDVVRLIEYEKELGVFIFLEAGRMPPHKVTALRKERQRVIDQLKRL